ncbi:MAG: acetate/propionate family kinase [Chloroflexi bacterium]|nr:acetate/propionate family kinase [Chloroflexota bacterium]
MNRVSRSVLTVNTGSSSLKVGVYDGRARVWSASRQQVADFDGAFDDIRREFGQRPIHAIGHRVVHGGSRFAQPARIDSELLGYLQELTPVDPTHLPQAIATIESAQAAYPEVPQVACFDTAFHRTMPPVAQRYPLPQDLFDQGVRRYGFHGLSYEYVLGELLRLEPATAHQYVVIGHLGNGASACAIRDGRSVDTTMGFSPTGGLMMGTRSGDLDPGVLLHLQRSLGLDTAQLDELVNRRAGLLGVSGTSSDMRQLLASHDEAAQQAIELFCWTTRKFIGGLVGVLGGLDTLVFTGGIGEHAPAIRRGICEPLGFLGIQLDDSLNEANAPVVSNGAVTVRVIPTDEDAMIAKHTASVLWPEETA